MICLSVRAMPVNLAEDRIADLTPAADGSIRLPVRGHQIVSKSIPRFPPGHLVSLPV